MSEPRKNISPEIEAAFEEGRRAGLREAVAFLRGLKQVFVPYILRGLQGVPETDAEGWVDMLGTQKTLVMGAARGVERLIDGSVAPPCEHRWGHGSGYDVCALCGMKKPTE